MSLLSATPAAGGTGYTVDDVLTVVGGTGGGGAYEFTVTAVGGSGEVTAVELTGSGYYTALPSNPNSVTGGTGTGCTLDLLFQIYDVTVTDGGTGYQITPNVFPSTGGAILRAVLDDLSETTVDCYVFAVQLEDIEGSPRKLLKWQTAPVPAPLVSHVDEGFTVPGNVDEIVAMTPSPNGRPRPGIDFVYTPPLQIRHAARQTLTFKFGSNFDDLPTPFGVVAPAAISSFFPISPNTTHDAITWYQWDASETVIYQEQFPGSTSYGQSNPYCISATQKRWRGRFRVKRVIETDPAGILY
jgi:hypothetical protein